MGPRLPLLVAVLISFLLPARSCILCERKVQKTLMDLKRIYLPNHLNPKHHEGFVIRVKQALLDFNDLQIDQNSYMGVIDSNTLEMASWRLIKDVLRMTESSVKGELFVKEFFWMLKVQKDVFTRQMIRFQREVFCPNKCGTMLQTLIWCKTCLKQVHSCHKSADCGERIINVHHLEDLVLNCELQWHQAAEGLTKYRFYRVWENNTETLVSEGKQPILSKPMVGPEDEGKYRCELGTIQRTPATILSFIVKVLPKKLEEEIPPTIAEKRTTPYFRNITKSNHPLNTTGPTSKWTKENDVNLPEPESPRERLRRRLIITLIWASVALILGLATA